MNETLKRFPITARVCCTAFTLACVYFAMNGAGSETWSHYGGSLSGQRYVANSSINPDTIPTLVESWIYRTGEKADRNDYDGSQSYFPRE